MSRARRPDARTLLCLVAGFTCLTARVEAAISVGPGSTGTGTNTFSVTPTNTEWSTATIAGGAGDVTTPAALDADVNTNNAANITTALGTSATTGPIGANAIARQNTTLLLLQTCPTGVKYNVLMATLQNNSGGDLVGLVISYDLGVDIFAGTTLLEEIPGHRVYFSKTGAPGSWTLATELSGGVAGPVSGSLSLGTWTNGALLYVLWVDDNASPGRLTSGTGNTEGAYTIDNWRAVGVAPPKTVTFQEGVDGYTGTQDVMLREPDPDTNYGSDPRIKVDTVDPTYSEGLIRFDNIFGSATNQIPPNSSILSASLTLNVFNTGDRIKWHQMLVPWDQAVATWNTMVGGVTADGVEAAVAEEASVTTLPTPVGAYEIPLAIDALQAWSSGTASNYGWAILPTGGDGTEFRTADYGTITERPKLSVTWAAPGALRITTQPTNALVRVGQTATFVVAATSGGAITYQWQKASAGSTNFSDVGGATTASYTTPATVLADNGAQYRCQVSSGAQSRASQIATLTVVDQPVLLAYWPFNDASDPAKTKDKIYLFEGALEGGAAFTADLGGRTGLAGDRAMDFGSVSAGQLVRISQVPFLQAAAAKDQITIAFWQKLVGVAASSAFWGVSPSSNNGQRGIQAHVLWSDNNIYFDTAGCCDAGTQRINANLLTWNPSFDVTAWHHFAFVKAGATKQVWVDGVKFLEGNNTAPLPQDFTQLVLGADSAGGNSMHGMEDDFAVFQGVLFPAQIAALASGTAPDLVAGVIVPTAPLVTTPVGSPFGYQLQIFDSATASVNQTTVSNRLDGSAVVAAANKVARITTVTYNGVTLFPTGSTHSVIVDFKDTLNQPYTATRAFTVGAYTVLPAAWAVTGVDLAKPGFQVAPYQTDGSTPLGAQPNTLVWTEEQLLGLHGPNVADLTGADASGSFSNTTTINYSIQAGTGTEVGNFTNDVAFPGIPGTLATTGNPAEEMLTYLHFPAAGAYRMGVNSDDGFKVTAGPSPRDRVGLVLGLFDGGRGSADTLFDIAVIQAGFYPFRLLWENGNGELPGNGANCEWFTVAADGTKILINDAANPVKAYRAGPIRPFVKSATPVAGSANVALTSAITIMLEDGTTQAQTNTIVLTVNDQPVTPIISKVGTLTAVTYDPPGDLPEQSVIKVDLTYGDNSSPAFVRTAEYSFTTGYGTTILFAIDDTMEWRYSNDASDQGTAWRAKTFNDSSWPLGKALLALETGTPIAEPIRTALVRTGPASEQILTDYFRGRFNLASLPFGGRLLLRYIVDDGAVFYINGVEVHRFGTAAATVVTATTLFTDHEGRDHYDGPVLIVATNLVVGENVMAVEVHQTSATSSDIVFGAELAAVTSRPPPAIFTSVRLETGGLRIEWTGTGTLEQATAVTGPWTPAPSQSNPQIVPTVGTAAFYRIRQ